MQDRLRTSRKRRVRAALAMAGVGILLASGCSGDEPAAEPAAEAISDQEFEKAMSTPTELTFWTWVPDIETQVAMFEKQYPAIDVTVQAQNAGEQNEKLRTVLEAGEGAPDIAQIEYSSLPGFVLTEGVLDLTPYRAGEVEKQFEPWVWRQVADERGIWAIPQDTGPLGTLYRTDLFTRAGISSPPATWAEFATAAQAMRSRTDAYLTNLPTNDAAFMFGLLSQTGATPFTWDGDKTVGIDIDTPEIAEVLRYWQDLVDRKLVSVDPDFTDTWYQGLAQGKYATWLSAAWGPQFLQGTAAATKGKWSAAPLPQWEGEPASGNWGGSSNAVIRTTKNPIAAAEFARWINTEREPTLAFADKQFLFPTVSTLLDDPAFRDKADPFFGGQKVNAVFADVSDTVNTEWQWLPFHDELITIFGDSVGDALEKGQPIDAALRTCQQQLVDYAEQQGFTVRTS
ncbi:MAG: ABC transporter substrate-binding protein [Dermatophilaceae bacterium]